MATQILGSIILWLIVAAIVVTVAVYLLQWLYRRSTKETAFVRTGFGGEKIIINGGAFVIPVLHEVTPVAMNVMRVEVRRGQTNALITRDRMRVDLIAEFFLRVKPTQESVAIAAQTLGRRVMQQDGIRELFEGKFTSALRAVAAELTLEEIHVHRSDFMDRVRDKAAEALIFNGLELETVSLVDLDQTSLEYFDPSNAFDAEGLTQLTEKIEMRRKMRNQIEQQTMIAIRDQNLESERRVLEIDRESEYARIEQEREIETRRAVQRADLARERSQRDQMVEQVQLAATEATEKTRIAHDRALAESRIASEEEIQKREIARRRSLDETELRSREQSERDEIAVGLAVERERVKRRAAQEEMEVSRRLTVEMAEREREISLSRKAIEVIQADIEAKRAEIESRAGLERDRVTSERKLDETRIDRDRALQALEIAKRQAFEEAEIASGEEIERARISTERGLGEARVARDRDLRKLAIDLERVLDLAEIEKTIEVSAKSRERSVAIAEAEAARGTAILAEEQVFTVRDREIAERRKVVDLISASRDAERDGLRLKVKALSELDAAKNFAEAGRISAKGEADAAVLRADAAASRYKVDADGQMKANEADNILTPEARASRARMKLLDKIEGIVRESVRPMEKIEGIKILHVDGMGGGGGGGPRKNVTDEVIDSALRYRVQAPMIDSLMKEVGIDGKSIGGMTDVLRDAKDLDQIVRNRRKTNGGDGESRSDRTERSDVD